MSHRMNLLRVPAAIVAAIVLGYAAFLTSPLYRRGNRLFYRDGRPNFLGRSVAGAWSRVFGWGVLPSFLVSLETTGRRTGRTYAAPVVLADYGGERYIVSMLGDRSDWVRNIRASGNAIIKHGGRRNVRLEEVAVGERAPILQAYLGRASGARPHVPIPHDAPIAEFEAIAASYPVFRIVDGAAGW